MAIPKHLQDWTIMVEHFSISTYCMVVFIEFTKYSLLNPIQIPFKFNSVQHCYTIQNINTFIVVLKKEQTLEEIWGFQKTANSQTVGMLGTLPHKWSDMAENMPRQIIVIN